MQIQVNIGIDQLIEIVRELPAKDINRLKREIEKTKPVDTKRDEFEKFLLNGPVFSKKQLDTIARTRKAIDKWRTK